MASRADMAIQKLIIAVSAGSSESNQEALRIAYQLGKLLGARKDFLLICGGRGGAMQSLAQGIKQAGGICIGILPNSKSEANQYVDFPLPTGLGFARNFLLVNMADLVIGIGGGWGTLSEIAYALQIGKPVILIQGSGGAADLIIKAPAQFQPRPYSAASPERALELIEELISRSELKAYVQEG